MGKKKSSQPKAATPRKKKLRLVDNSPVGLTLEQQQELRDLYRPLSHTEGPAPKLHSTDYKRIVFERMLYIYVETLCHDARTEIEQLRRRPATTLRRQVFKDMNKTAGRELSPDDIVKELSKCAPVPAFAAQAIRRDYLRVSV
jgi:hypothetical protein